ncbi:MAG: GTPase Era [Myxococcales bacterium]|nr:GTPase Era [Myxococcales bacterium]
MTGAADDAKTVGSEFRAGTVGLCGRPNVGKSSLLNALVGAELAVATRFAQTTRERMLGVWSEPGFQAVLVDTPGIHRAKSALNKFMVDEAMRGARAVDVLLLLAEAPIVADAEVAQAWEPGPGAKAALEDLITLGKPIALVLTKIDRVEPRGLILPVIAAWARLHAFSAVLPVSAHSGEGLDAVRQYIAGALPVGPPRFEDDRLSDRSMRWHAGERVRAALFKHLGDELPYACAVTVESYKEQKRPPRDIIRATIHVERDSQKAIVIGRGGQTIKAISMDARRAVGELSGRACDLFLNVVVTANWTRDPALMQRLGLHEAIGGEA